MPIIKSAKKRVRTSERQTAENLRVKRQLRSALKKLRLAVKPTDVDAARRAAQSAIDKAAKKKLIHKRKAARAQAQLSVKAKAKGYKPTKTGAAKAAPKKTATKTSAKTAAAKKSPVKKPVAKK